MLKLSIEAFLVWQYAFLNMEACYRNIGQTFSLLIWTFKGCIAYKHNVYTISDK